MPRVPPILLIRPISPVAVSKREGRPLKKRIDSLITVGTTTERKAMMNPTTII